MKKKSKLIKNKCEVESCSIIDEEALHYHHIIERTQINCSNEPMNLAILCAVHHELTHSGKLKIIGVYPSTKLPNGRTLIYELNGKRNIEGIDESYFTPQNKSYRI
jgi:hypothetical protein